MQIQKERVCNIATIENDFIRIDYKINKKKNGIKIKTDSIDVQKVEIFCEAIEEWLDVTELESQDLDLKVMELIEKDN